MGRYFGVTEDCCEICGESGDYMCSDPMACATNDEIRAWSYTDSSTGFSAVEVPDAVNKPDHYTPKEGEIECIAYIEQVLGPEKFIGYCHGNVTKYLHRHTYKGKPVEDLEKAQVYLGWMIKAMKGERVR
jgi:hypothetical protein